MVVRVVEILVLVDLLPAALRLMPLAKTRLGAVGVQRIAKGGTALAILRALSKWCLLAVLAVLAMVTIPAWVAGLVPVLLSLALPLALLLSAAALWAGDVAGLDAALVIGIAVGAFMSLGGG